MRSHGLATLGVIALTATLGAAGCKDGKAEAARRSEREVPAHIREAREGLSRLVQGFVPLLNELAPTLATPVAASNEGDTRFELMGMRTRQVPAGSLTMYPTGFVVAVRPDGTAIARDVAEADDLMRGMQLRPLMPPIASALTGEATMGLGELPASADQPARRYLVAAAPIRGANGATVGVLAAGISYGRLALALDRTIRVRAGQVPVLWVGLHHDGRVYPSGADRDVAQRWLVPQPLIAQIPRDWPQRLAGRAHFTWNFVEGGARGWGAGMGTLPDLPDTHVVIYRSEAEQR